MISKYFYGVLAVAILVASASTTALAPVGERQERGRKLKRRDCHQRGVFGGAERRHRPRQPMRGESGRDVEPLAWFEGLALWKAAVFCEAIYGRYVRGELGAEDERAARFEQGVPYLAESAAAAISR